MMLEPSPHDFTDPVDDLYENRMWDGYRRCIRCNGMFPEEHVTQVGDKYVCRWDEEADGGAERSVDLALATRGAS